MAEHNLTEKVTLPILLSLLNKSEGELTELGIEPQDLLAIYNDYLTRQEELNEIAAYITTTLQKASEVHALRYRVKEPLHLLKKIIRKKKEYPHRIFDACSYLEIINDLIGVRVLYLNKNSWAETGRYIKSKWELKRLPIAYISKEGTVPYIPDFKEQGCKVITHPSGYRAVHFVIETKPNKQRYFAEIQLRTLIEEAWSEIDHRVRYPDLNKCELSIILLQLLNKLTVNADKMVTLIPQLNTRLAAYRHASETDRKEIAAQLEVLINSLPVPEEEKQQLQAFITRIKAKDKL